MHIKIDKEKERNRIAELSQNAVDEYLWVLTASRRYTKSDREFLRGLLNQRQNQLTNEVEVKK